MKKALILLMLIMCAQQADAQLFRKEKITNDATGGKGQLDNKFLSWGYFLGFNSYDFNFDYKEDLGLETDVLVEPKGGFNVGLVGDMRINEFINLRFEPGLYYTQRRLVYREFFDDNDRFRDVQSTYVHFPLLVKFSTRRLNNFKPFVVAGVSNSINLSSNEKNPEDNAQGQFRTTRNTSYYELGFGIDLYLFYFKFTPSIRGVFATSDELVPDANVNSPYTSNIAKLGSRGIFINFTFQ